MKKYSIPLITIAMLFLFWFLAKYVMGNTLQFGKTRRSFSELTCKGLNNISETYQFDCLLPLDVNSFVIKAHYDCQSLTNHQFSLNKDNKPYREQITTTKSDYLKFTLDFKGKEMIRSLNTGSFPREEHYTIVKNDNSVIQAMRPMKPENITKEHQYEFITFSKNTGHGMEIWHNIKSNLEDEPWRDNNIAAHFFKCK